MSESVSVDQLIEKMYSPFLILIYFKRKQDKKYIDDKEKERQLKFKIATETYLK